MVNRGGCELLTVEQADSMGILHNYYLSELISSLTCENISRLDDINQARTTVIANEDFDAELVDDLFDMVRDTNFDLTDFSYLFEDFNSVQAFLDAISDVIVDGEDMEEISDSLTVFRTRALSNLECLDLSYILTSISVASNSSHFWLPVEDGGLGRNPCNMSSQNPCSRGVIQDDVTSAGISLVGWLFFGTGPEIPLAELAFNGAAGSFLARGLPPCYSGSGGGSW